MGKLKKIWAEGGILRAFIIFVGLVVLCCFGSLILLLLGSRGQNGATSTPIVAATPVASTTPIARATLLPTSPAIVVAATNAPAVAPTQRPTASPVPTVAPTPTASTPEGRINAIAKAGCGNEFISGSYFASTKQALVACEMPDNFTQSLIVAGTLDRLVKVSKEAFASGEVDTLVLQFKTDLKDQYGNVSKGNIFVFNVSRAMAEKVNWANVTRKDVGLLVNRRADGSSVIVHPSMREAWDGYLK